MPAKKASAKSAKRPTGSAKKTTKPRKKATPAFQCPNPGPPMKLRAIIKKMGGNQAFALFIHDLLCRIVNGDKDAEACLRSYFDGDGIVVGELCVPPSFAQRCNICTDQWFALLASPAYAFS